MRPLSITLIACLCALAGAAQADTASGDDPVTTLQSERQMPDAETRQALREQWQSMTREERSVRLQSLREQAAARMSARPATRPYR